MSAVFSDTSVLWCERVLISPAAIWLRSASFFTSWATAAKPLPCSPALAASMAAFMAKRLVCRAISSMMVIFSAMFFITTTALATVSPLILASSAAFMDVFSVTSAFSAERPMLDSICSMAAATSSALDACSDAPWATCSTAEFSWLLLLATRCADSFT